MEIERKYLVGGNGWRECVSRSYLISQGYLSVDECRSVRVRLRCECDGSGMPCAEGQAFLTIKGQSSADGLLREEFEYAIPYSDAERLLAMCVEGRIDKVRHIIPFGELNIEVDEFSGANAGLVLAEVELPDTSTLFDPPAYLSEEVTGDKRYYNMYLAQHPYSTWSNI